MPYRTPSLHLFQGVMRPDIHGITDQMRHYFPFPHIGPFLLKDFGVTPRAEHVLPGSTRYGWAPDPSILTIAAMESAEERQQHGVTMAQYVEALFNLRNLYVAILATDPDLQEAYYKSVTLPEGYTLDMATFITSRETPEGELLKSLLNADCALIAVKTLEHSLAAAFTQWAGVPVAQADAELVASLGQHFEDNVKRPWGQKIYVPLHYPVVTKLYEADAEGALRETGTDIQRQSVLLPRCLHGLVSGFLKDGYRAYYSEELAGQLCALVRSGAEKEKHKRKREEKWTERENIISHRLEESQAVSEATPLGELLGNPKNDQRNR